MCLTGTEAPCDPFSDGGSDSSGGSTASCTPVQGTPVAVSTTANTIKCESGNLVVQNNNSGPDRACTDAHESSHMEDWKARYGDDLCDGVSDGELPLGGDGYDDFLRQSECKGYRVGKTCREGMLESASDADRPAIDSAIARDEAQIAANCD